MFQLILAIGTIMNLTAPYELSFRTCGYGHGVPPWLLKGMGYETSHFNALAHGHDDDRGVMQVLGSNASGCGLTPDDLYDPGKNICCASWLMDRNLDRVRALGASGSDAYLLALMRNNMGGGNVDGVIGSGHTTWASFKAATPNWPNKHAWVERMWETAKSYRVGEYAVNALGLGLLASLFYYIVSR